jgi:uncharacterized protein DUF4145
VDYSATTPDFTGGTPLVEPFRWTCPHCGHPQIVTESNYFEKQQAIENPPAQFGPVASIVSSVTCQNPDCGKMTLDVALFKRIDYPQHHGFFQLGSPLDHWKLIPESNAKPQPDYIPGQIVGDYVEACRIRDLSPKASATLARRCLQGMIRDFCKISRKTLDQEIKALRALLNEGTAPRGVTPESVDGIDHVRSVGNIGAHMEADVNMIVDIESGEAQMLIELIETLFDEWYVAQHKREQRFAGVKALAETKKAEVAQVKAVAQEVKAIAPPKA